MKDLITLDTAYTQLMEVAKKQAEKYKVEDFNYGLYEYDPDETCIYVDRNNMQPRCIIGVWLNSAHDITPVQLEAQEGNNATDIANVFIRCEAGLGRFLDNVQAFQDNGYGWIISVEQAKAEADNTAEVDECSDTP